MPNDMRDRLVELIKECFNKESDIMFCENRPLEFDEWTGIYADHLIANGVMLPPCKIGETLYCIVFQPVSCKLSVKTGFVKEFRITKETLCVNIVDCEYIRYANLNINVPYDEFGKTVFLTKEQAEQKLKEMRVENGKIY